MNNRNDYRRFKKGDFMKRQLTLAVGLMVLAAPAFATKARLQALGEDIYGSQYINDNRNIWLNAAQINNHKDLVTYEFGNNNQAVDTAATPRSEGGVYKAMGNLTYGVHFGSASNTSNQLRMAAGMAQGNPTATPSTLAGTANEENNVDVFVGGDAGVKWGANLGYAKGGQQSSVNQNVHSESLRTRLGAIMGDTQVYANINLINNASGFTAVPTIGTVSGTAKFNGKSGIQVGAIHAWEGNTLFVDLRDFRGEGNINTGSKQDQKLQQAQVGIGRVTRLNDKTNLFTKGVFAYAKAENDSDSTLVGGFTGVCSASPFFCKEYKTMRVPVVIGLENETTSWLTLRASIAQVVWGNEEDADKERQIRNSTAVNAGATLKFGELSVDGVIGNSTDVGAAGDSTGAGNGTLRLDTLMTRVGMTYRF